MNPLKLMARLVGTSAGHKPPARTPGKPEITDSMVLAPAGCSILEAKCYPEAERIAASLRDFPGDWAWDVKGHTLKHTPTGFVLWMANEDYGLGERSDGRTSKFSKPEQAIVWPAVESWLASHKVGFTGRLPKVKIGFSDGAWWCLSERHPWVGRGESPTHAYRSWARAVSIEARTDQRPNEILHVWSTAQ